jgi:hypothetical protein
LYLPTLQTDFQGDRVAKLKAGKSVPFEPVSESDVPKLQSLCVEKIKSAAATGRLKDHSEFAYLLNCWSQWGDPNEAKGYVTQVIGSDPVLILERCLRRVTATDSQSEFLNSAFPPGLSEIPNLISLDSLHAALVTLNRDALSPKQQTLVDFFDRNYSEYVLIPNAAKQTQSGTAPP